METQASFEVTIVETGEAYACHSSESLLHGMARMGKKGIPLGCRGGGCGVCKVQILAGDYTTKAMSRDHVSADDSDNARLLACRVFPKSDLVLTVLGAIKKNVCRPQGGDMQSQTKECQLWQ